MDFNPLHTELSWKKVSSEPPDIALMVQNPCWVGMPHSHLTQKSPDISISVIQEQFNLDPSHLRVWSGKTRANQHRSAKALRLPGLPAPETRQSKSITTKGQGKLALGESSAGSCLAPMPQAAPHTGTPQPPAPHQALLGLCLFCFSPRAAARQPEPRCPPGKGRAGMLSRAGV